MPTNVDTAAKLAPFVEQAIAFARAKADELRLRTAILDDWSGIRLIYETDDVLHCANACETCPTCRVLGADDGRGGDCLRTTLVAASATHTDVARNRMLNCKTTSDYMKSFTEWLVRRCQTAAEFHEELLLVRDFRVVFSDACRDADQVRRLEREMKQGIVRSAMARMDSERRALFARAVETVFAGVHPC